MKAGSDFANGNLLSLAHKVYLQAAFDRDWLAYFIAWAIIYNLEDSHAYQ